MTDPARVYLLKISWNACKRKFLSASSSNAETVFCPLIFIPSSISNDIAYLKAAVLIFGSIFIAELYYVAVFKSERAHSC